RAEIPHDVGHDSLGPVRGGGVNGRPLAGQDVYGDVGGGRYEREPAETARRELPLVLERRRYPSDRRVAGRHEARFESRVEPGEAASRIHRLDADRKVLRVKLPRR